MAEVFKEGGNWALYIDSNRCQRCPGDINCALARLQAEAQKLTRPTINGLTDLAKSSGLVYRGGALSAVVKDGAIIPQGDFGIATFECRGGGDYRFGKGSVEIKLEERKIVKQELVKPHVP